MKVEVVKKLHYETRMKEMAAVFKCWSVIDVFAVASELKFTFLMLVQIAQYVIKIKQSLFDVMKVEVVENLQYKTRTK